jgi:hypothetical protein
MSYRKTSAVAYHQIIESGLLKKSQLRVYQFLYDFGPTTINAVLAGLAQPGQNTGVFTGRFSELEEMGVITIVGKTKGPSGHTVNVWDVTPNLPAKRVKRETKSEQIRRLQAQVVELQAEVARLKNPQPALPIQACIFEERTA